MSDLALEIRHDAQTFRSKVWASAIDLLHSQKVQILILGHVLAAVEVIAGVWAKQHGIEPALVDELLTKALLMTGLSTATVTGAHAYVDGAATAAQIAADAGKAPGQVIDDVAHAELARVKAELMTKTQQLAAVSQVLQPVTGAH